MHTVNETPHCAAHRQDRMRGSNRIQGSKRSWQLLVRLASDCRQREKSRGHRAGYEVVVAVQWSIGNGVWRGKEKPEKSPGIRLERILPGWPFGLSTYMKTQTVNWNASTNRAKLSKAHKVGHARRPLESNDSSARSGEAPSRLRQETRWAADDHLLDEYGRLWAS